MELIEVDPLDAQRLERGLKLLANSRGGEVVGAVEEPVKVMAELGGHKPKRAVVTAEIIADQAFGKVVAVAFGGVDQVNAEFARLIENGIRLDLGKGAAPLAAILPGAEADDRYLRARAAKISIAHEDKLPQNRKSGTGIIVASRTFYYPRISRIDANCWLLEPSRAYPGSYCLLVICVNSCNWQIIVRFIY